MIWSSSGFLKTEVLRATQFLFYVIVVDVDFRYFCSLVPCFNQQRRRLVADFASVASFTTSLFGNIKSSRPRLSRERHNKCRLCRPNSLSPQVTSVKGIARYCAYTAMIDSGSWLTNRNRQKLRHVRQCESMKSSLELHVCLKTKHIVWPVTFLFKE